VRARLPGLETMGLAASLPTLPVGLACHGRSSEHVWENEMFLLTGDEQANVVRGDDLKVHPIDELDVAVFPERDSGAAKW